MSQTTFDPYLVLGIPRTASQEQVQRAYRRLAKRYHPDLHPDAQTSEQMRRVNHAWETLSSPGRRARYEAESVGHGSRSFGHWSASARRSAPESPPPQAWDPAWASPSTARGYARPASRPYEDDGGPGWPGIVMGVMIGLIMFVALFAGVLPVPLFGIAALLAFRGIFGRVD